MSRGRIGKNMHVSCLDPAVTSSLSVSLGAQKLITWGCLPLDLAPLSSSSTPSLFIVPDWILLCYTVIAIIDISQANTPVPRPPLPICLQCRLLTTSSLCQPRSSRRASPSSQQLWSAGFICGRPCDMELVIRQSERFNHQQRLLQAFTEVVVIFSLLVYTAHWSFLDDALYKFTY